MTDLSTVSTDELFAELRKRGQFVMITIATDEIMQISTDEQLGLQKESVENALQWVWDYYDTQPDREAMIDYVVERAQAKRAA